MLKRTNYLTKTYDKPDGHTLGVYERELNGYQQAKRVLTTMTREQVVDEAKKANIRGRGGAGFPMGVKWSFMPKQTTKPCYLIINADEGEPGTHKDRTLMEENPHACIEGCIIGCYGIGAHVAYIYVRDELHLSKARLEGAIKEARAKGYLGKTPFGKDYPVEVHVHSGAGAYICGEETSMLNSLEGLRGEPRLKPPFPAVSGAFGCPTIVNNVETIAAVPDIVRMGGKEWAALSRLPNDGGTRLYGVSGHVKKPGIYEGPVGLTLRELIYDFGGGMLRDDRPLKAVIPGGSSTPVLRPDDIVDAPAESHPLHAWHGKSHIDVPMGVDTYRALGTMLGTCCAIVMDSSVSMVEAARNLMHFYHHESCGQCTPCREGTGWLHDILNNLCAGRGKPEDVALLVDVSNNMMGNTICAFADGTAMPMLGFVQRFRDEFVAAAKAGVRAGSLADSVADRFGGRR